jgi:hypothetical protein
LKAAGAGPNTLRRVFLLPGRRTVARGFLANVVSPPAGTVPLSAVLQPA